MGFFDELKKEIAQAVTELVADEELLPEDDIQESNTDVAQSKSAEPEYIDEDDYIETEEDKMDDPQDNGYGLVVDDYASDEYVNNMNIDIADLVQSYSNELVYQNGENSDNVGAHVSSYDISQDANLMQGMYSRQEELQEQDYSFAQASRLIHSQGMPEDEPVADEFVAEGTVADEPITENVMAEEISAVEATTVEESMDQDDVYVDTLTDSVVSNAFDDEDDIEVNTLDIEAQPLDIAVDIIDEVMGETVAESQTEGEVLSNSEAEEEVLSTPEAEEEVLSTPEAEEEVLSIPEDEEEVLSTPEAEEEVLLNPESEEEDAISEPVIEECVEPEVKEIDDVSGPEPREVNVTPKPVVVEEMVLEPVVEEVEESEVLVEDKEDLVVEDKMNQMETMNAMEAMVMKKNAVEETKPEMDEVEMTASVPAVETASEEIASGDDVVSASPLDETALITKGLTVRGDLIAEGSMNVLGTVEGNIQCRGKLVVSGAVYGNAQAGEIFANNARVTGDLICDGSVKIGQGTVIVGNVAATSAVIAGAVKGDIDVHGPVIVDSTAIVMGDIKSESVQINIGAAIEGHFSQCYAAVSPTNFFKES
ncbi:MAG: polymer-forming cytoskeletal protein [Lachnospiraceae bacterium]